MLAGTNYRLFIEAELTQLSGDWPALASAAHRERRDDYLRTAAENSTDPRVWTWHASNLANRSDFGYMDEPSANQERWSALERLKSLDPENGAAELLQAFLYLKVGLKALSLLSLGRAFKRERITFYERDRWHLLWASSQKLGWTLEQTRYLVLGSGGMLLKPISIFRKELCKTNARRNLKKLALQEMKQPLLIQQMLGCSLLQALEPQNRAVKSFRKRSVKNRDFIQRLLPEQLSEQRWERYYSDVIERSENEAIEALRDEGYEPHGDAQSWLEKLLS